MKLRCIGFAAIVLVSSSSPGYAQEFLLFGGRGNDTFLGCLNCNRYDGNSICNKYGDFGSKYSGNSIFNKYGDYGSKYSNYSPWNKYSTDGPVIVDNSGNFYGRFTINRYASDQIRNQYYEMIFEYYDRVDDLSVLRDIMCE